MEQRWNTLFRCFTLLVLLHPLLGLISNNLRNPLVGRISNRNKSSLYASLGPPPKCILVAAGSSLSEEHLESLDNILLTSLSSTGYTPVVPLSQLDLDLTLRDMLFGAKGLYEGSTTPLYKEKDHDLPDEMATLSIATVPVILFSGLQPDAVRSTIANIRSWNGVESGPFPRCAFAIAVPAALDKTLGQLLNEIQADFAQEKLGQLKPQR
jgi:hypothetical protein